MLPTLTQRLILAVALLASAPVWWVLGGWLTPADGSAGLTLGAAWVGPGVAAAVVVLGVLPAVLTGLITAGTGNPLCGVFVVSASVSVLAGLGGSAAGFLRRAALPEAFGGLIAESAAWAAVYIGLGWLIHRTRLAIRRRTPVRLQSRFYGGPPRWWPMDAASLAAGLASAGIGGVLAHLLLRVADSGQAAGAMVLGFGVGAMLATVMLPGRSPVAVLVSPLATSGAAYGWTLLSLRDAAGVWSAWHAGALPGLCLALPVHAAGFGVVGAVLGVGLGQAMSAAPIVEREPPARAGASGSGPAEASGPTGGL